MRILYLGNFLNSVKGRYDGPNVQVVKILQSHGHNVRWAGSAGSQILRLAQFISAIIKAKIKKIDFIIIDVFSTKAFYFAVLSARLGRLLGVNYALVLHGGNLPERFVISERLSRSLLVNASLVSSPSNYLAIAAKSAFDVRVKVIPNRIVVKPTKVTIGRKNEIFWVRSLGSIYNPEMAVEVLKKLTHYGLDFKLIFIGPGNATRISEVEELVSKYGLTNRVEFKGMMAREKWHDRARNGKYFLNTTYVDNTPSSVIEAMALGLVPISTNVGGIPYILESGIDSILVNPNESEEMASAIKRIEKEPMLRKQIELNARLKFKNVYHDTVISQKWLEALAGIS